MTLKIFKQENVLQDQQCVTKMLPYLLERGNPFLETEQCDLSNLITGVKMEVQTSEFLVHAHEKGETAYQTFVDERLTKKSKGILDPIHKMFPPQKKEREVCHRISSQRHK